MKSIDPNVRILVFILIFFTIALFASEVFFRSDGQFFSVVSSMAAGAMASLLTLIKANSGSKTMNNSTDMSTNVMNEKDSKDADTNH